MRGLKTILSFSYPILHDVCLVWASKIQGLLLGEKSGLFAIILISWGLAFFEYTFQVPANRAGYEGNGGPFNLV
jgi:uncharacterized protein